MGSVYRKCEPRKQKGRYIYNRNRLHKVGWKPKHKKKYIELMQSMDKQIKEHMNQQIEDKIVLRVLARFNERSQVGIKKYNTTLERSDLSTLEWLTHAQEEAMDFVLYLERLKDEYKAKQKAALIELSNMDKYKG
jgi:hypothetical protein